jgi:hypothetical protein
MRPANVSSSIWQRPRQAVERPAAPLLALRNVPGGMRTQLQRLAQPSLIEGWAAWAICTASAPLSFVFCDC